MSAGSLYTVLVEIGDVVARLDRRRHTIPARLELSVGEGCWVAQILADPLRRPLIGTGPTPPAALEDLHEQTSEIDWRNVSR